MSGLLLACLVCFCVMLKAKFFNGNGNIENNNRLCTMTLNFVLFRGTLNNNFLLNTLKTLFRLFRVLKPFSGHPLFGHLSISQNLLVILTVKLTSMQGKISWSDRTLI